MSVCPVNRWDYRRWAKEHTNFMTPEIVSVKKDRLSNDDFQRKLNQALRNIKGD